MTQALQTRIMVIGGGHHFSYLMQRYVRVSSHQITFVNPGDDVLALIQREKPAAIVLAADLPATIGWHMLRALKADHVAGQIPVIFCSWLDEEQRGLAEGADIYLRMPILYEDFEAALSHLGLQPLS
jgi:CheY-like chemotaxis protein